MTDKPAYPWSGGPWAFYADGDGVVDHLQSGHNERVLGWWAQYADDAGLDIDPAAPDAKLIELAPEMAEAILEQVRHDGVIPACLYDVWKKLAVMVLGQEVVDDYLR